MKLHEQELILGLIVVLAPLYVIISFTIRNKLVSCDLLEVENITKPPISHNETMIIVGDNIICNNGLESNIITTLEPRIFNIISGELCKGMNLFLNEHKVKYRKYYKFRPYPYKLIHTYHTKNESLNCICFKHSDDLYIKNVGKTYWSPELLLMLTKFNISSLLILLLCDRKKKMFSSRNLDLGLIRDFRETSIDILDKYLHIGLTRVGKRENIEKWSDLRTLNKSVLTSFLVKDISLDIIELVLNDIKLIPNIDNSEYTIRNNEFNITYNVEYVERFGVKHHSKLIVKTNIISTDGDNNIGGEGIIETIIYPEGDEGKGMGVAMPIRLKKC